MKNAPKMILASLLFATSAMAQNSIESQGSQLPLSPSTIAKVEQIQQNENASSEDYENIFDQMSPNERVALLEKYRQQIQELRAEINRLEAIWEDPYIGSYQGGLPLTFYPGYAGFLIGGIGLEMTKTNSAQWSKRSSSNKAFVVVTALSAAYLGYRTYKLVEVKVEKKDLPQLKANLAATLQIVDALLASLKFEAE